ncbi:MAG: SGNH/GDSL hydrolase family protein [Thermoanaerobaculia bacterium]
MTWKRRSKLLLALGTFACAALAGEFALRRYERARRSVPETMPYLYYRHSRLRYALVRNGDYYGWAHVNAQGFRGRKDVAVEKPAGVLRVLAVGGSTTFETNVSGDARAWPARMQLYLRELAPGKRVEVVNAGVPGYRDLDNLIRLETDLYRYQPDVIILYEVHNDLYAALRTISDSPRAATDTPGEMPAATPWGRWLSRHSLLYMKLGTLAKVARLKRASRRAAANPRGLEARVAGALARGAADFERTLTAYVAVANSLGIHVVMPEVVNVSGAGALAEPDPAIRRVWEVNFPFAKPEAVLGGYARFNDAARRVAGCAASATYLPTAGFGLRGTPLYAPHDPIHFNDQGADRMGREMAKAFVARGLLERRPAGSARCEAFRSGS